MPLTRKALASTAGSSEVEWSGDTITGTLPAIDTCKQTRKQAKRGRERGPDIIDGGAYLGREGKEIDAEIW